MGGQEQTRETCQQQANRSVDTSSLRDQDNTIDETITKTKQKVKTVVSKARQKLCRRCKQLYYEEANTSTSCHYHPGRWMGAEESKHYGTRSGGEKTGLALFWDCCDGEDIYAV